MRTKGETVEFSEDRELYQSGEFLETAGSEWRSGRGTGEDFFLRAGVSFAFFQSACLNKAE
jgi:hypothetical protein